MNRRSWQLIILLIIGLTYGLLFYLILTSLQGIDFVSFYSAAKMLINGENPYQASIATFLPTAKKIAPNLNPPIVLMLFSPLLQFNYNVALISWSALSFLLGLIGAEISFRYSFSPHFLAQNRLNLYLAYLAFFATIMNTAIAQLGAVLLFLLITGYHFYLKHYNGLSGIIWGSLIAAKLFPGLLLIYALIQKRYAVFFIMSATALLLWLIPFWVYGTSIYLQYFSIMSKVIWYGDSWNGSIYGFLFRLIDGRHQSQVLLFIQAIYCILFLLSFLWYLKRINKEVNHINHQPLCFTLVMMLLMSPFGWLYYFSLLIFPLTLTWSVIFTKKGNNQNKFLWLLSLFFLNFPLVYIAAEKMGAVIDRILFNSFYFYGLLILAYLISDKTQVLKGKNENHLTADYLSAVIIIFSFGLLIPFLSFLNRLLGSVCLSLA
ncbi:MULTISPECIES: glycosyltransferase family 87 protein [unclassified Legionella]|uniref:glycosyltransferase family 87 protein n=1 Tax=unclassified Legionella TaxID=2622702 RepID=UPI0010551934|nr:MULTISPECIES: glycosyltransferase family 87 protein [unclassified Legionella]MDI9818744.1 glycosyltransferase family 87 protein [Legionella sp. PL877]